MSRGMSAAMDAEVVKDIIRVVWMVRLDILGDPVVAWTGHGPFLPTGTGDAALDGQTFLGLGPIDAIGNIKDSDGGSKAVTLTLPGVDLNDTALQQVVLNENTWQFRQAWIWFGLLNETLGVIANPTRIKTGRMDQMKVEGDGTNGTVTVTVESFQSYAQNRLGSKYIQQPSIDPTDQSQKYVHDLANKQPQVGVPNQNSGFLSGVTSGTAGPATGDTTPFQLK